MQAMGHSHGLFLRKRPVISSLANLILVSEMFVEENSYDDVKEWNIFNDPNYRSNHLYFNKA